MGVQEQIVRLRGLRSDLANNLTLMGVASSPDEPLQTLVPKVLQILQGGLSAFGPVPVNIPLNWSGTGPFTQNIPVADVKAAWDWRLDLHLIKITDDASRKLQEKAMGCITWCETYDGGITLTCRDSKPEVAIQCVLAGEV